MSDPRYDPLKGPWFWRDAGGGGLDLFANHGGRPTVLDCMRKGMQGAVLRVRGADGVMRDLRPDDAVAVLIEAAPELRDALAAFVEGEPACRTDHNAFCQEHACGAPCRVDVARKLLARIRGAA